MHLIDTRETDRSESEMSGLEYFVSYLLVEKIYLVFEAYKNIGQWMRMLKILSRKIINRNIMYIYPHGLYK